MKSAVSSFEFSKDVVGIIVDEDITGALMDKIHAEIDEKLIDHKKINLFIEIKNGKKISLKAFWKDLVYKQEHAAAFGRVAVVTDIQWFKSFVDVKNALMKAEMRTFAHKDRIEALNWISQ